MAEKTAIQWTDHTFNPRWGCTEVSEVYDARPWSNRQHHSFASETNYGRPGR